MVFIVELSDDEYQLPLNTLHTAVDFSANAYITQQLFPYGYLTLTDHFDNSGVGYIRSPQSHSLSMLMGINSLAAYLQLQVVWV
ncbi:T3SS effector OspC family protein [Vibrio aestuarianus]|uniref:T3SS effector OspC family protein n=1 Tax=Vibrio aestuarianus TaxID=28171 RepID=UPI003CE47392